MLAHFAHADVSAYLLSRGFRTRELVLSTWEELAPYVAQVASLRYRVVRERLNISNFQIWSVVIIRELRSRARPDTVEEPAPYYPEE